MSFLKINFLAKSLLAVLLSLGSSAMATETSLFTTQTPASPSLSDGPGVNYELGMKFQSSTAGYIKSVRFYKSASEVGTHTGRIFSAGGTQLASVTFTGETSSGWQVQNLSTPLAISANTTYVVSVNTAGTYYAATSAGLASQITNGVLSSIVGNNGVYGSVGNFPTNSYNDGNYFRDVVFADTLPDVVAPTVSLTSPTNEQTVSPSSTVALTATASDDVAIDKVEMYRDSVLVCTITSSPYTCNVTASATGDVVNTIQAKAFDTSGNYTWSEVRKLIVWGPTNTWTNKIFDAHSRKFTAEFDVIPKQNVQDVVVGLTRGTAGAYSDLAANVRFGNDFGSGGIIDVRDGNAYNADQTILTVAGTKYHIRMVVDVWAKTYSVYVTPAGLSEVLLAEDYNFRDTQSGVVSLGNRAKFSESGDAAVLNFTVTPDLLTTFPNATNTGVPTGTTLTAVTADYVITTNGTVIDSLDLDGSITIDADNVTIKNSKITSGGYAVIRVIDGRVGTIVQDCEINNLGSGHQGIHGYGTFLRNNIYGASDGIDVTGDSLIEDNYIHGVEGDEESHNDTIQADGGYAHLVLRHNTIINEVNQTSAIMLDGYWSPITGTLIENNRIVGGGYTMYISSGNYPVSGVRVLNNRLGTGYWGYVAISDSSPVWSGNVDDVTSSPVEIYRAKRVRPPVVDKKR